ncbi:hypothetical protein LAZ67_13000811 [Cordylochernes scorpioides]|uniref:Reverse transcriptase domain-containing protein n=1 Tax=Cordylochernes scorpioides TaxID=51811 RepID=A0ABY6L3B3_9ARAC|nr:hypothetical protein LAZ67_13000811 [Cordylochernes scorpioides]
MKPYGEALVKGSKPKSYKSRPVPFSLKERFEEYLQHLEDEGIISPIQFREWSTLIVPVIKKDDKLRICGDYKITVNPTLHIDRQPIPKIDEIFTSLIPGPYFTKLDLKGAYHQIQVDPELSKVLTLNTYKGLYAANILPFGISSAPGIFQRIMDQILQGLPGVTRYLDDILLSEKKKLEDHLGILGKVLARLRTMNLELNKCLFLKEGLECRQTAAREPHFADPCPKPKDVNQSQSFLRLANYYRHFLPNLSQILSPLNWLLRKNIREQENAFSNVKKLLVSEKVLVHFNPVYLLILACDASSHGLGVLLFQRLPDNTEKPIAFASRTLSKAGLNYSQIDKEATAIEFGVFFSVIKEIALGGILGRSRVFRLVVYKSTDDHKNADALSRNFLLITEEQGDEAKVFCISQIKSLPISDNKIKFETQRDLVLSNIKYFVLNEWPTICNKDNLKPFYSRRLEIRCHSVWWPDHDIEDLVKICVACQQVRRLPNQTVCSSPKSDYPWHCIHMDYAGPSSTLSNWPEVEVMKSSMAYNTIRSLREIFSRKGLPQVVVMTTDSTIVLRHLIIQVQMDYRKGFSKH